jgi:hypothetical protein
MSKLTNIGARWTKEENDQLIRLYNEEEKNILEIAKIHKRAPGGIIARLVMNKLITEKEEARGYDEFMGNRDQITKEVKEVYKEKNREKREKTGDDERKDEGKDEIDDEKVTISKREYLELKTELRDIKRTLNMILEKFN